MISCINDFTPLLKSYDGLLEFSFFAVVNYVLVRLKEFDKELRDLVLFLCLDCTLEV